MKLTRSYVRTFSLSLVLGACAQAYAPPGGEPDREAPRIIATVPEQNAVVADFSGPVIVKFDETLSERGPRPGEQVFVSPESGDVKVDRDGSELKITVPGGWQKGRIYHVTVMPGYQDRFNNARRAPFDLIFSTGPQILPTALGGIVRDRLTGRPLPNARIVASGLADSVAYATMSDTAGFFMFQGLPVGAYNTTAYVDLNRNRKVDGLEPRAVKAAGVSTVRDTVVVEYSLLAPDTTPARLLKAEARDSMQVRLTFDDYIEGDEPLNTVIISLWQLPDSTQAASGAILHVKEWETRDRASREAAQPAGQRAPAPVDTARALPTQDLVFVPGRPLLPKTRYRVIMRGIRNIAGVPNGGGTAVFETAARLKLPPLDTVKPKPDLIKR